VTEQGPPATEAQTDTDASTHGPFTDGFLDALGRWQRGWRRDRKARGPIGAALEREAASLPGRFREPRGRAYRKRHLYRTVDQNELGGIDTHRSQIMAAARWTKPVKWTVRRS
jgi:hypothetical protein